MRIYDNIGMPKNKDVKKVKLNFTFFIQTAAKDRLPFQAKPVAI